MTPSQLLDQLDYVEGCKFPMKALQEVIERREEMIPHLLSVLESVAENPSDFLEGRKSMLCTYAAYLLAQFREAHAYRPLMAILNLGDEIPQELFGDSITEDMPNIVASVFDGDEAPLRSLIENPGADEYARACGGVDTYPVLVHAGLLSMESVEDYFCELLERKLEREHCHVWSNLCSLCGDFGFVSLIPQIRKAYEEGLCDMMFDRLESIESRAKAGGDGRWKRDCALVDDVVSIMENWACFDIKPVKKPAARLTDSLGSLVGQREFSTRPNIPPPLKFPGVTRNDPCPCVSGCKFKKCCGG